MRKRMVGILVDGRLADRSGLELHPDAETAEGMIQLLRTIDEEAGEFHEYAIRDVYLCETCDSIDPVCDCE